jgi:hypothetical protein
MLVRHTQCVNMLLLLPIVPLTASASPPPAVRSITLHIEHAAVPEIVDLLRKRACAAVSFIPAVPPGEASIEASGATVPEVLGQIARRNPIYRSETIAGRDVLYPSTPEFQRVLDHVEIESKPRQAATEIYVDRLRKEVPAFLQLLAPMIIGNAGNPVYTDIVSLRARGRVIEQLMDLVGQNKRVYLEFFQAKTGRPAVIFTQLSCNADSN